MEVFRGLKFEPDAEIGQKGVLCKGLIVCLYLISRNYPLIVTYKILLTYLLRFHKELYTNGLSPMGLCKGAFYINRNIFVIFHQFSPCFMCHPG